MAANPTMTSCSLERSLSRLRVTRDPKTIRQKMHGVYTLKA
jgi:hypothetical protein